MISPRKARMVKNFIRNPFAWPGGYPLTLITDTGECSCHKCTKKNYRSYLDSSREDGRYPAAVDVIWEGPAYCEECGEDVAAYEDPDTEE